jgi:hypothetical protein
VSFWHWHGRALKYVRAREGRLGYLGEDGSDLGWALAVETERGPTGSLLLTVVRMIDVGQRGM